MAVPRSRILDLLKAQSRIFNTTFNPTNARLGNSVLRQRLRGPSLAAYYPRRVATFKDLRKLYPEFELYDNFEEDRLEHIQIAKSRGKGAPKKKRTAAGEYFSRRSIGSEWWSGILTSVLLQKAERIRRERRGSGADDGGEDWFGDLHGVLGGWNGICTALGALHGAMGKICRERDIMACTFGNKCYSVACPLDMITLSPGEDASRQAPSLLAADGLRGIVAA